MSSAIIASGFLCFIQESCNFYSFLVLTASLITISLFSISFFKLTQQIKSRLLLYIASNFAFLFLSFIAFDLFQIIYGISFHHHFFDVSSLISNFLNAIIAICIAHLVYVATKELRHEAFISLKILRPHLIFILFFVASIIFGSAQFLLINELNNSFTKLKENFLKDAVNEANKFKTYLFGELNRIYDSGMFFSKLPGLQWRLKDLMQLRLKEYMKMHAYEGVETVAVLSESGEVENFSGKKLGPEEIKILRNNFFRFPRDYKPKVNLEGSSILAKIDNEKVYFYFMYPIYQIDQEPNKGTKPDFKRKGFLVIKLDVDLFVNRVQSTTFDGSSILFACFSIGREYSMISYASDVLLTLSSKKAFRDNLYRFILSSPYQIEKEIKLNNSSYFLFLKRESIFNQELFIGILYPLQGLAIEKRRIEKILDYEVSFIILFLFSILLITMAVVTNIGVLLEKEIEQKQNEITKMVAKKFEITAKILEDLPFGILLVNKEGEVKLSNVFGEILLERNIGKSDNIKGTKLFDLRKKLEESGILREELILKDRVLGVTLVTLEIDGEDFYLYGLSDITEVRAFQQAAIIESQLIALGKLVESYSHQINNPLQIALSNLELLLMKENLEEDQRKLVESAKKALEKIRSATKSIVQMQMPSKTQKSVFDLNDLVAKLAKIISPSAKISGIKVELELEKEGLYVECVQSRIEEALLLILTNSIEALTNYAGTRKIRVITRKSDGNAIVEIEDTGPGIPREIIDQIFDPFFTTKTNATGLGLFLSRKMIELEGGSLNVISEEGMGAKFIISLKLHQK